MKSVKYLNEDVVNILQYSNIIMLFLEMNSITYNIFVHLTVQ